MSIYDQNWKSYAMYVTSTVETNWVVLSRGLWLVLVLCNGHMAGVGIY